MAKSESGAGKHAAKSAAGKAALPGETPPNGEGTIFFGACGFDRKALNSDFANRPLTTVVLRYDDYSTLSPTDMESRFLEACALRHVPCTFGVVPEVARGDGASLKSRL